MADLQVLYSRRSDGKIQTWTIEVKDGKYRTISGIEDGTDVTSEWTECQGKNTGRSNATTPAEQALKEAKALWQKKLDKGYKTDKADVDNIGFFEPMLAHVFDDYKDSITFPVYAQPKLDGIRCIANKDGLWTRNGKKHNAVPHIYEALKPLFKKDPGLIFDGELYCDKLKNNFNRICSLVKRQKPTENDLRDSAGAIQYWVYDLPSVSDIFSKRYEALTNLKLASVIKLVETKVCANQAELDNAYDAWLEAGYEGQIVRLDSLYENKRSKSLLKRKEFKDGEWTIIDVLEGTGNRAGTAGYMTFKTDKGIEFKSNIKGDMTYLTEVLKNRLELIGKPATIKYFNLTPDGVPRFPFVINIDRSFE